MKLAKGFIPLEAALRRRRTATAARGDLPLTGFTLIELLIVIGILSLLAAIVVIVINPSELLARGRDAQRLHDLDVLRSAITLYLSQSPDPELDSNATCDGTRWYASANMNGIGTWTTDNLAEKLLNFRSPAGSPPDSEIVAFANVKSVNGIGWLPINFATAFASFNQASPISSLPVDPVNNIAVEAPHGGNPYGVNDLTGFAFLGAPTGHFYAYLCNGLKYQIQANMESQKYGTDFVFPDGGTTFMFDSSDSESVENKDGGTGYSSFIGSPQSDPVVFSPFQFSPSFLGDQIYQVGNDVGL